MNFYKYCASGNDFVIFSADKKADRSELAKILCNRYEGIGADGLVVLLPHKDYDFEWEFYNKDGSSASMCGNASRAVAHFAHYIKGMDSKLRFLTAAGVIEAKVEKDFVEVNLGKIKYTKEPFEFENKIWQECDSGVPHLVHFCENLNEFDKKTCEFLRKKYNANVNYAEIPNKNTIKVRTFERGVEDETLACGTGMAACFHLAFLKNLVQNGVKIIPKSKEEVFFRMQEESIYFKGKVRYCFEANYNFS